MTSDNDPTFLTTATLPDPEYDYFEDIVIPAELKEMLVRHGITIQRLARAGVDMKKIACSGVVELLGPQGTGKTSLGRGVPNELAKRLNQEIVFRSVDANQLFSADLGASPEAVADVFDTIVDDADQGRFQCILIDEVEALLHSRDQLSTETDPTDVTRCVLTVLQRLDDLIAYPTVLVYATSNQPDVLDSAFLDRADLRLEVGPPTAAARAAILSDVFSHLNTQLGTDLPTHPAALDTVVDATEGTSARSLRNLAFGALVFGDDSNDLSYDDVRSFLAQGRLEDDGFTLSTTDDQFTVDPVAEVGSGSADSSLTFVYDRQATANTVRSDIPDEFQTGQFDRRYKRIELAADTPEEWIRRAADDAVDIIQSVHDRTDSGADEGDTTVSWFESTETVSAQADETVPAAASGATEVNPRRVVYNSRHTAGPDALLATIKEFVADTLAQADTAFAQHTPVLLEDDRVKELFYALTRLQALEQVQITAGDFSVDIDVGYDVDHSDFLDVPDAGRIPDLDEATIRFCANGEASEQVRQFTPLEVGPLRVTAEPVDTIEEGHP